MIFILLFWSSLVFGQSDLLSRYNSYVDDLRECGKESSECHNEALVPEPGRYLDCMKKWFICINKVEEKVLTIEGGNP